MTSAVHGKAKVKKNNFCIINIHLPILNKPIFVVTNGTANCD